MDAALSRFRSWWQRLLLNPFSNGILGFAVSFITWFLLIFFSMYVFDTGKSIIISAQLSGSNPIFEQYAQTTGLYSFLMTLSKATGFTVLQVGLTILSAFMALIMTIMSGLGGWIWSTTVAATISIWFALNGQPLPKRSTISVLISSGILLVVLVFVAGFSAWLFVLWETLLLVSFVAVVWRSWQPAKREFFGANARIELALAIRSGKTLGVILLLMLGISLSAHEAIANLPPQWMLLLIIIAATVILFFYSQIESSFKKALKIALCEREVHKIRSRK